MTSENMIESITYDLDRNPFIINNGGASKCVRFKIKQEQELTSIVYQLSGKAKDDPVLSMQIKNTIQESANRLGIIVTSEII